MSNDRLESVCAELESRFDDPGRDAAENLRRWVSGDVPLAYPEAIQRMLDGDEHIDLIFDSFWRELPFGTGGRRGNVGFGPNRINQATVALSIQGHCDFLDAAGLKDDDTSVVVANDVRCFADMSGNYEFIPDDDNPLLGMSSRSLAKLACEIYAGNGITAYIAEPGNDDAMLTTPELSFAIRHLDAAGGINMSASHNHPDDNGIKVYDPRGGQYIPPDDENLARAMREASDVQQIDFDEACEKGLIRPLPDDVHKGYLDTHADRYAKHNPNLDPTVPIAFTPLCGCGLTSSGEVLERLGFTIEVPPDQGPDGSFKAIPLRAPNPEVSEATAPAKKFAADKGITLVLSSDPDADRIGADVRLRDGSWYHLTGNQIAAVLAYHLLLDPDGPELKGLVVETGVTTRLLGAIAREAGGCTVVDDLLVGFKYVAEVLRQLDENGAYNDVKGKSEDLVLAAEESHGVLTVANIRDKDAASGVVYLAGLHQTVTAAERTLVDYLADIYKRFGPYGEAGRSIVLRGNKGTRTMAELMKSLRESPPEEVAGYRIAEIVDYWDEERFGEIVSNTDREARNVLEWKAEGARVTVRPSGTEPKLKLYMQLVPDTSDDPEDKEPPSGEGIDAVQAVNERADEAARAVYRQLLERIDRKLSDAALMLPDIVALDDKVGFDEKLLPSLWEQARSGDGGSFDDTLEWLGKEAARYTSGADPLPALRDALARAAGDRLEDDEASDGERQLAGAIQEWAGGRRG